MLGDWLTLEGVNFRVVKINNLDVELVDQKGKRYISSAGDTADGLPLTSEILEKNGFKDYGEIREYQFAEDGEQYRFYLKKMYKDGQFDCWGTNIGGVLPSLIKYVHELQHALRLCGLAELADNFKI